MKKDIILKVVKVSKQYRLGQIGTGTLSHDLNRWWHKLRGKEDPYLKIGDTNDRSIKGSSDYVWALKDINFEVERGEIIGIIGKNGAGKSTLLKLLSRVTSPTTGEINFGGRVASLLEVGTGFHSELTGRENIYLNGAILGMTKKEITSKIDEIIDFSGCERYIDTPVKRYSSGMYVRLAFAVAAFLEPEILIVDEVLAVGDAEFQKKAIGKMQDISMGQGRTVLFVSHNMAAVKSLCTSCIVLENGTSTFEGNTNDAIDFYLKSEVLNKTAAYINAKPKEKTDVLEVKVLNTRNEVASVYSFDDQIKLQIKFSVADAYINKAVLGFRIIDQLERVIFSSEKEIKDLTSKAGIKSTIINLPKSILVPNEYRVIIGYHVPNIEIISLIEETVTFNIVETGSKMHKYQGNDYGCVVLDCYWN